MLLALVLSAAVSGNVLRDEEFTLTLPPGTHATRFHVNFEADTYTVRDAYDREIAMIYAGGGAYDLRGYGRFCLNGTIAWRLEEGRSGALVSGYPGVNAVSVDHTDLDPARLHAVKKMLASLRMLHAGTPCGSSRRSYPTRS